MVTVVIGTVGMLNYSWVSRAGDWTRAVVGPCRSSMRDGPWDDGTMGEIDKVHD